jgi:AraC-like DNA-binding protein
MFKMENRFTLHPINLSNPAELNSMVEHKRVFSLKDCELNIFETYRQCSDVSLSYNGLVITSMMRGKKVMYLSQQPGFDFLPGETVVLPEGVSMKVDFPEADDKHPVQCATLSFNWEKVNQTIDFLNENYPRQESPNEWKLNFSHYHFYNNRELTNSLNRLISISMGDERAKDALADLELKSLLVRVIQTQNMALLETDPVVNRRLTNVIQYIRQHLTEKIGIEVLCEKACMSKSVFFRLFKNTFGISPLEYIIRERIDLAKSLLKSPEVSVTAACYQSGFNNLNYFARLFKRIEGVTPSEFQNLSEKKLR